MNKIVLAAWIGCLGSLASGTAGQSLSCRATLGPAASTELVNRCLNVSPATHPPCNASNPCSLILAEIARGCAMLSADKPEYCGTSAPTR